jgi:uncharacterized DUF497 family protein
MNSAACGGINYILPQSTAPQLFVSLNMGIGNSTNYKYVRTIVVVTFEWDETKNEANVFKHGIDFELAITAFRDADCIEKPARIVGGEQRHYLIGAAESGSVLFVVFTWRHYGEEKICRIISVRTASKKERGRYPAVH